MSYSEDFMRKEKFGGFIGVELIEVRPGYAKARLALTENHLNGLSTAHGGVVFTLADIAFAAASNADGRIVTSISNNISYIKAASSGVIEAEAKEIARSNKLVTYSAVVYDDKNEQIASFTGMGYVITKKSN